MITEREADRAKICITAVASAFLFFICMAFIVIGIYKYSHTFTAQKWHRDIENRYKLVDSLTEKHQLVGMTEAEIISLLGNEDSSASRFKIAKEEFPSDTTLVYYIGCSFMDSEWLIISLKNGVAVDWCIDVT